MPVSIQIADISHAPAIARLSREALGYDYPEAATAQNLSSILNSPSDRVFVALSQGEVVGYVHACDYLVLYAPAMKNIMGIAVDAAHRREGIGTLLLAAVENWAIESGAAGIRLVSGAARTHAHQFYRSLGFGNGREQRNFKKFLQNRSPAMNSIICIAGPTASGKTALAVALAKELNGEVVSCDSMQVYRRMDIGTAKPTKEETQGIPHHMLDVAEPEEDFSVSRYCEMAAPIVEDIVARGKTAIIAGGTGLYMDSLIRGNDFAPFPSTGVRERLEQEAEEQGIQSLYDRLCAIDPEAAGRLHLSDQKRIIRALEVYLETGETITAHNRKTQLLPPRFHPLWLGLDFENRADLYARIDRRVGLMLEAGLIEEIQGLLSGGIPEKCTALQAIGYKEFIAALHGDCTIEEAADQVRQASRRYAKRQLTWFRRNKHIHWLTRNPGQSGAEIVAAARQIFWENDR